jgi:glutathione S-transferase
MLALYYYPGNANLAPHMLLEELGVAHRLVLVDRAVDAHKSAAYLALNPNGRLPTLVDGALVLFETAAICLHLADTHPQAQLAPPLGTPQRADFYRWLMYLTNTVQAEMLFYFYPERLSDDAAMAARVKFHAEARVAAMFDLLEVTLLAHGGPYFLGTQFTAIDPYLFMVSRWSRMMARPARSRPALAKFLALMAERPSVQRAFAAEGIAAPYF